MYDLTFPHDLQGSGSLFTPTQSEDQFIYTTRTFLTFPYAVLRGPGAWVTIPIINATN